MICCGVKTSVIDSRLTSKTIRRRRQCSICNERYTTVEILSKYYIPNSEKVKKLLNWLTSGHNINTSTKEFSDYWAYRFKFVIKKAKEIKNEKRF